jgi:hypothetical protein
LKRLLRTTTAAIATAVAAAAFAGARPPATEYAVKMRDLARNPGEYVGDRVVISDCLMISFSTILGAQCSVEPIDASILVYVDADTLAPAAVRLADDCSTMDPTRMCVLKVTGEVALNYRFQPIIRHATLEIVRRPLAI